MTYRGWVGNLTLPETGHLATKQEVNNVSSRVDTLNNLISQGLGVEGPTTIDINRIYHSYNNGSGKPQLITFKSGPFGGGVVTHNGNSYTITTGGVSTSIVQSGKADSDTIQTTRSYLTYATLLVKAGDTIIIGLPNSNNYEAAKRNPDRWTTPTPYIRLTVYTLG